MGTGCSQGFYLKTSLGTLTIPTASPSITIGTLDDDNSLPPVAKSIMNAKANGYNASYTRQYGAHGVSHTVFNGKWMF